jgi:hypothetical protein
MDDQTSTLGTPQKPFRVSELKDVLAATGKVPVGFFVSQALYDRLSGTVLASLNEAGALAVPLMVDPSLDETHFDVALTREAWGKRCDEIVKKRWK